MKGFKNVFAAGALGVILTVTGCAQYTTPVTDTSNPANTGTTRTRVATDIYGNRFANRTARNTTAKRNIANTTRTTANRMTVNRSTGRTFTGTNVGRVTRTAPSGNQYQSRIGTQGRARTSGTAGMSGLSAGLPNADMYRRDYAYNTGNVTHYPTRALNNTGSPFGDYNKDRAYSLTRGATGVNNINQQASQASRNTSATNNTGSVGAQTVRKSFQAGTARNASNNTAVTAKASNNTGTAHKSAASRSTNKSNATRNTSAAHTTAKAHNTINRSAGTRATKNTGAHTVNRTTHNAGTNAANITRGTGSTLASNTSAAGTGITANNTAVNNTASHPRTGVSRSTVARNINVDKTSAEYAYNANPGVPRIYTRRLNRSTGSSGNYGYNNLGTTNQGQTRNGRITQTAYDMTDRYGNTPTASNILAERGRNTSNLLNNGSANSRNSRSSYRSVNRGTRSASLYGYNDDFLRGNGYDNLTYGSTYRNADLRNSYYPAEMPYEIYGYPPYYGMSQGYDTYGNYSITGTRYGRSTYPGYTRSANRSSSSRSSTSRSNRTRANRMANTTRTATGTTRTTRGHNIAK